MNDSIGVPADSQGTTPITLALVVQNLEAADDALGRQHYDALVGILAEERDHLLELAETPTDDPLWQLTMEHLADACDLLVTMVEAEASDDSVSQVLRDGIRQAVAAGGAA